MFYLRLSNIVEGASTDCMNQLLVCVQRSILLSEQRLNRVLQQNSNNFCLSEAMLVYYLLLSFVLEGSSLYFTNSKT